MSEYKKIDPDKKAKWLTALRSGEYQQNFQSLCSNFNIGDSSALCCIGVGAKVCGAGSTMSCTMQASAFLGLTYDVEDKLTVMNDDNRMSFPDIANWIDLNL